MGVKYQVFKVRLKNTDVQRGKSGGYRVIYYVKTRENIILATIYSKSDRSDVNNSIIELLKTRSPSLGKRYNKLTIKSTPACLPWPLKIQGLNEQISYKPLFLGDDQVQVKESLRFLIVGHLEKLR